MNQTETTRQADEGAEAWRVPPRRYLREHPPGYQGERLSSRYVSARDGTRLAVDVHLPGAHLPGAQLPGAQLPEIAPEPVLEETERRVMAHGSGPTDIRCSPVTVDWNGS